MEKRPSRSSRPSPGRWLIAVCVLLVLAVVGLAAAFVVTRGPKGPSAAERSAVAAELAATLQSDFDREGLSVTAEAHADGIDLIFPPAPVRDAAEHEASLSSAHPVVDMLHVPLPAYAWRCEVRNGDSCIARARHDLTQHDIVFDDIKPP